MSSILKVDQLQDSGGNAIITSNGSGTITTPGITTGKVLQVVSNSSTSSVSSSTHTSFTELINASITLASTSSKVLILTTVPLQITASDNAYAGIQIYRGTISGGTALKVYAQGMAGATNNNQVFGVQLVDEPSSTGSQQYTIGIRTGSGGTTSTSTDGGSYQITLLEIQG